jgi:hypothetical protein
MNVYEKLQEVKLCLAGQLKKVKQGYGYKYFELSDFLPTVVSEMHRLKLCSYISFGDSVAVLKVVDSEKPDDMIMISSPVPKDITMLTKTGKSSVNEAQKQGALQTYFRRYLYMSLLDISEGEIFDNPLLSVQREEDNEKKKQTNKKKIESTANQLKSEMKRLNMNATSLGLFISEKIPELKGVSEMSEEQKKQLLEKLRGEK